MKLYQQYIYDESERLRDEAFKNLAFDENNDGLLSYKHNLTDEEHIQYGQQAHVIDGIYCTICNLLQIENIEYCCGGGVVFFTIIHNIMDNIQAESPSPYLSREKLLPLKIHELAAIIIDIFLDRDNWSKEIKYSRLLSDGNGNWL